MRALLDVNVLVSLLDPDHVHHATSRGWLRSRGGDGWASCALTQNGCARVMSSPAYPGRVATADVLDRLAEAVRHPAHAFWPGDVSLLDEAVAETSRILGPRQLTDAYLVALAVRHGGRVATLDHGVAWSAVRGATRDHVETIGDDR
jgi:toxin-antitoxin system PIN domain toxin